MGLQFRFLAQCGLPPSEARKGQSDLSRTLPWRRWQYPLSVRGFCPLYIIKSVFQYSRYCHTLHGLSGIGECRSERSPQSFDFCATLRRAGRTECGLFHRSQARILRSQKRPPVETSGFGGIMDSFRQNGQFSEIPRVKIPKIWVFPKSDFTFPKSNFTIQEARSGARGRAGFCRESPAEAALRVSAPAFVCVPALRRAGRALQK